MRAAIFRNGEIVVDTLPEPKPGAGAVLVKTLACGICGSDLHARKHAHRMVELSRHLPGRQPMDLSRDVVFGHEFCCEILDYGPGTQRKLKPAIIFECVGVPGLLQQVFEGAPRDARIVVVGVCMETDKSEPMLGIMKELNVQYVLGYTPDEFAASLRLIAEGQVDAAAMVTAEVGIDGVAKAFADLANPEAHTKIIVQPWR